jgi:predicted RNA polymerase sigma factor
MIDSGVGSDIDSIDKHLLAIIRFAEQEEPKKLRQEIMNLRENMFLIVSMTNPEMNAFVTLIHSVDGREITDLSQDGINRVLKELNKKRFSITILKDVLKKVKKKLT